MKNKKEMVSKADAAKHFHIMDKLAKAMRRYEDLVSLTQRQKVTVDQLSVDANDSQRAIARRYKLVEGDQFTTDGTITRKPR